jgi:hypothetical protein
MENKQHFSLRIQQKILNFATSVFSISSIAYIFNAGLYLVVGALRKVGEIVLLSASSAFAAKIYPGGGTTHQLYGTPTDEYNPYLKSLVSPRSDHARLLLTAKFHVIDEIGGPHSRHLIVLIE